MLYYSGKNSMLLWSPVSIYSSPVQQRVALTLFQRDLWPKQLDTEASADAWWADGRIHTQKKRRADKLLRFKIRYDHAGWQPWPGHTVTTDGGWDLREYKFTNCRQAILIDGLTPIKPIRLCDRCLGRGTQIANWIHTPSIRLSNSLPFSFASCSLFHVLRNLISEMWPDLFFLTLLRGTYWSNLYYFH